MSTKSLSELEVIRRLKRHIQNVHGSQRGFAKSVQVSDAYVSAVLTGKTRLPAEWLSLIGVSRMITVTYFGAES